MATVRAIHHSIRGGVRRFRKARSRVDSGTSTSRHRFDRLLASRERPKLASSQLLQSDLTFGKFLVDEAEFVVLQEDLHVELVFDGLLQGRFGLCGGGDLVHGCVSRGLLLCRVVTRRANGGILARSSRDVDIFLFGIDVHVKRLGGKIVGSMDGSSRCGTGSRIGQRSGI